jgi:two-component system, NarL family, vancomycin resistance associated response regulator VraR
LLEGIQQIHRQVSMLICERPLLRVLVADDHELTRYSLKLALKGQEGIELVGLAMDGQEAIALVKRHRPDVVILDLQMPNLDGMSAASEIKRMFPDIQILAYSSLEDPKLDSLLREATISEFCRKDTPTADLISRVRQLGLPLAEYPVF